MIDTTTHDDLIAIIESSAHVLIDFDGPICNIFAGLPAQSVATELLELLSVEGIRIPIELEQQTDPLEVLRFAGNVSPKVADRVDSIISIAELQAVGTATSTSGSRELIIACCRTGRSVGIVSNNSEAAVENYLREHDLAQYVDHVSARTHSFPYLLKPDPHLILRSIDAFGSNHESFVLVGDSVSDIQAAQAASIRHIGYANKQGKVQRLVNAGANAVIATLTDLTAAVLASTRIRPS